jgi:hypothetical protein
MIYLVDFDNKEAIEELEKELAKGPLFENGKYKLEEKTIAYLSGLKILIFSDEHPPPHFRILDGAGCSNDFTIDECKPLHGKSLSKYFRNIKKWHLKNKELLILAWNERRPTDCPVGIIKY